MAERVEEWGGTIWTDACVVDVVPKGDAVVAKTTAGEVEADHLINCAGLYSDQVAEMSGADPDVQIVPFRGEYYELVPSAQSLCRGLIYPVPDPSFPFLGVHFTRRVDGGVECGPNAVLSFAREGYRTATVDWEELTETVSYSGFQQLARRYWRTGVGEMWRSVSKSAFVRALQSLVPEIKAHHLEPAPAGVRAQAVTPEGQIVDDFLIHNEDRVVNVCNAPSPGATSCFSIGAHIADCVGAPSEPVLQ